MKKFVCSLETIPTCANDKCYGVRVTKSIHSDEIDTRKVGRLFNNSYFIAFEQPFGEQAALTTAKNGHW